MTDIVSARQRHFVEEYLRTWNASEAARLAGYAHPDKIAWKLANSDRVKEAIRARMSEVGMKADEVITRLTEQARGNISDFITVHPDAFDIEDQVQINWDEVKRRGHMIKKITPTRYGYILEMHDAQRALELIGKALAMFTENVNLAAKEGALKAYVNISPDDWNDETQALIQPPPEG